jgi:hypothetical protein
LSIEDRKLPISVADADGRELFHVRATRMGDAARALAALSPSPNAAEARTSERRP